MNNWMTRVRTKFLPYLELKNRNRARYAETANKIEVPQEETPPQDTPPQDTPPQDTPPQT